MDSKAGGGKREKTRVTNAELVPGSTSALILPALATVSQAAARGSQTRTPRLGEARNLAQVHLAIKGRTDLCAERPREMRGAQPRLAPEDSKGDRLQ